MNGRVRSVNLRLDRPLMRCDMPHTNVIDTGTIVREEYTTHGLHLNSRGKMRLTYLIAESIHGGHVPSWDSSIPVFIHARASLFRLRSRAHMCLTYIKCSNLCSKSHGKIVDSLNSLNIFHKISENLETQVIN